MRNLSSKYWSLLILVALICTSVFTPVLAQAPQTGPDRLPGAAPSEAPAAEVLLPGAAGTAFRYVETWGVNGVPYVGDTAHLNSPSGISVDAAGNIYVIEENGARLLKFDNNGANLWAIGQAGRNMWDQNSNHFNYPNEVTQDAAGNLWVADNDHVASYDANGTFRFFFPTEPWNAPSENQFRQLRGVAFDSGGRLYLSDRDKNRVQVYTIGAGGVPVFAASLGVQGSALGQFDNPSQIVVDPSDNSLYVTDVYNFRVQKCAPSGAVWPWTWTCSSFAGGSQGSGANQLKYAFGLGMDAAHNLLIADSMNGRILKCTPAGSCAVLIQASGWWPADIAMQGANYLVTDYQNHVVKKFNASGILQGIALGTSGIPYVSDLNHFYHPAALAVDPAGSVYMTEANGQRLFKFDNKGAVQWSLGTAGVQGEPPDLMCWGRGLAFGPNGKLYQAGCNQIRIYTAGGVFLERFYSPDGSSLNGIAVDSGGRIFVADNNGSQIFVYDSSHTLVHTIGGYGTGAGQFANPTGLTLDGSGNLYVADANNCRVQKFSNTYAYLASFGQAGVCADYQDHTGLGHVSDVAVDSKGRIYVADSWLNRVQVLDGAGKYLATMGGEWSDKSGGLRNADSVEVDLNGNVYVTDVYNARVQKFAPGVPAWQQVNLNGFFVPLGSGVSALAAFKGSLYAGVDDWVHSSSTIMRSDDGVNWVPAAAVNFGSADHMSAIVDMIVYNDYLYAGTGWGDNQTSAQIWRTQNGADWSPIETRAFGIATATNLGPFTISAVGGTTYLYAAANNDADGAAIFRSLTGDAGSWTPVMTGGFGAASNAAINAFTEWNGQLYLSVENHTLGGSVWTSVNGSAWTQVGGYGFGDANNIETGALVTFNNAIYVPTRNNVSGGKIYRLDAGPVWTPVMQNGFGNTNNYKIEGLFVRGGKLYANLANSVDGMGLMVSENGLDWKALMTPGLGSSNNGNTLWRSAAEDFNGALYIGTFNWTNGGQIWRFLEKTTYLPLLKK